jgi:hypothetical protein
MAKFTEAVEYAINKELNKVDNIIREEKDEFGLNYEIFDIQERKVFAHALAYLRGKGDAGMLRLFIQAEMKDQTFKKRKFR